MKLSHKPFALRTTGQYLFGAAALFLTSTALHAQQSEQQEEQEVEEVVVTGSFIRNSQFTNASPVVTIGQEDLWQSGAANLGEYLRDMPYMENKIGRASCRERV